jgi:hypothetical protein
MNFVDIMVINMSISSLLETFRFLVKRFPGVSDVCSAECSFSNSIFNWQPGGSLRLVGVKVKHDPSYDSYVLAHITCVVIVHGFYHILCGNFDLK